jgi:ParB family chromosome partitioning protein
MSNSGIVSRIAGDTVGADGYLPNMGTEDFLVCLSRQALETAAKDVNVAPRQRVRETRAVLVDHFKDGSFVHPSALFAPAPNAVADLIKLGDVVDVDEEETPCEGDEDVAEEHVDPASNAEDETGLPDDASNEGADPSATEDDDTAYGIAAE